MRAKDPEFRAVNGQGQTAYRITARDAALAEKLMRIEERRRGESGWQLGADRFNDIRCAPPQARQASKPLSIPDTDSGLGIGGAGRYIEPLVIPELKRQVQGSRCHYCGLPATNVGFFNEPVCPECGG